MGRKQGPANATAAADLASLCRHIAHFCNYQDEKLVAEVYRAMVHAIRLGLRTDGMVIMPDLGYFELKEEDFRNPQTGGRVKAKTVRFKVFRDLKDYFKEG